MMLGLARGRPICTARRRLLCGRGGAGVHPRDLARQVRGIWDFDDVIYPVLPPIVEGFVLMFWLHDSNEHDVNGRNQCLTAMASRAGRQHSLMPLLESVGAYGERPLVTCCRGVPGGCPAAADGAPLRHKPAGAP